MDPNEKLLELAGKIEAAIEAGDVETADELTAEAEALEANIARGEKALAIKAKAETRAAEKAKAEKEAREAEIEAKAEELAAEKVAEATKNLGVQRPDYADPDETDAPPAPSMFLERLSVASRHDRLPLIQQAVKYQVQRLSYRQGHSAAPPPDEKLFRALCVRANNFLRQEDELARLSAEGEAIKCVVPSFDPELLGKWGEQAPREEDTIEVEGMTLNTFGQKGVTQDGIKGLIKLAGAKANELVYSTQAGYGDELGISSLVM